MMKHFALLCIFLSAAMTPFAAEPAAAPAANTPPLSADEVKTRTAELQKFAAEFRKQKPGGEAAQIEKLRDMMNNPRYADRRHQEFLFRLFLEYGRPVRPGLLNYEPAKRLLPELVREMTASDRIGEGVKRQALEVLARHWCDVKDFAAAEAAARQALTLKLRPAEMAGAMIVLSEVYRYQDRYDDAMKVLEETKKYDERTAVTAQATLALLFDREEDAEKILSGLPDPYWKLRYYCQRETFLKAGLMNAAKDNWISKHGRAEAVAFVKNKENDDARRAEIASEYLFDFFGTEELSNVRKMLSAIPAEKKKSFSYRRIVAAWHMGDYRLFAEAGDILRDSVYAKRPDFKKMYVISLAAAGREQEAADLCVSFAADPDVSPADRARFRFYEAILKNKPADGLPAQAGLSRKEEMEVVRSAARQSLLWNKTDRAMSLAREYRTYFKPLETRTINIKFFEKPVSSIAAWRSIYPGLEKQICNNPFSGSMDFLETDVATGRGEIKIEKGSAPQRFMELSAACDVEGFHLFLRVEDPDAMRIRNGFARGIGTEMYFAPGVNQPYTCFGSGPVNGLDFLYPTTYNNPKHRRLDDKNPRTSFRSEVEFTESDYVLHLFFAWDNFYDKLPSVSGTDYRFECISWTPNGGFTWAGSRGIHSASTWGNLHFALTEKQLNAIRRNLIFKTFRNWKSVRKDKTSIQLFDRWGDDAIGDPLFYQTMLRDLEKELDAMAASVREDMSDEEVAELYTKALLRWKEIPDEIDRLRGVYLSRTLMQ